MDYHIADVHMRIVPIADGLEPNIPVRVWYASCACGFVSPDRDWEEEAWNDASSHDSASNPNNPIARRMIRRRRTVR